MNNAYKTQTICDIFVSPLQKYSVTVLKLLGTCAITVERAFNISSSVPLHPGNF